MWPALSFNGKRQNSSKICEKNMWIVLFCFLFFLELLQVQFKCCIIIFIIICNDLLMIFSAPCTFQKPKITQQTFEKHPIRRNIINEIFNSWPKYNPFWSNQLIYEHCHHVMVHKNDMPLVQNTYNWFLIPIGTVRIKTAQTRTLEAQVSVHTPTCTT